LFRMGFTSAVKLTGGCLLITIKPVATAKSRIVTMMIFFDCIACLAIAV